MPQPLPWLPENPGGSSQQYSGFIVHWVLLLRFSWKWQPVQLFLWLLVLSSVPRSRPCDHRRTRTEKDNVVKSSEERRPSGRHWLRFYYAAPQTVCVHVVERRDFFLSKRTVFFVGFGIPRYDKWPILRAKFARTRRYGAGRWEHSFVFWGRLKSLLQVWWTLFPLMLTNSVSTCLQHSQSLEHPIYPVPVGVADTLGFEQTLKACQSFIYKSLV